MGGDGPAWSKLGFAEEAATYKGPTQKARVLTEGWVAANAFCPSCGADRLSSLPNNAPVADFRCAACSEEYELKATKGRIDTKLNDGAYGAMMSRLASPNSPNLMVMRYDKSRTGVTDLIVVPSHFFTSEIIEPRRPLGPHARRAGWQGCNILIGQVPQAGRIPLILSGLQVAKADVVSQWRSTVFLRDTGLSARGWLLAVMRAVEAVGLPEFTLADVYAHEDALQRLYPANQNVRPKIRQQLQVLRDRGWIEFNGRGTYRLIRSR